MENSFYALAIRCIVMPDLELATIIPFVIFSVKMSQTMIVPFFRSMTNLNSQKKRIKSFNPNKNCKRIFQQQIQNMFNEWWNVVLNYLKHTSIYKWQTQNESALQCGWIFYVLWLWAAIAVHRRIRCCCCYHFLILYEHRNTMRTMKQHIPVTPNSLRLLAGVTSHDFMTAFFLRASFYLP